MVILLVKEKEKPKSGLWVLWVVWVDDGERKRVEGIEQETSRAVPGVSRAFWNRVEDNRMMEGGIIGSPSLDGDEGIIVRKDPFTIHSPQLPFISSARGQVSGTMNRSPRTVDFDWRYDGGFGCSWRGW